MNQADFVYAHHDLTGVRTIEIEGWTGGYQVLPKAGSNPQVTIEVPRRVLGESWAFGDVREGVLGCQSSLAGTRAIAALEADLMLTVYLPPRKVDVIDVRLV